MVGVCGLVSCKEAIGPVAAIAANVALVAVAEGIRSAMEGDGDKAETIAVDENGYRRLVSHPLVNLVATKQDGVIGARTFASALQKPQVVWLAIRHDNPDHWRIASRLVASLAELGTRPQIVFEAIPLEEQARLVGSAAALGESLPWARYGIDTPAMLGPLLSAVDGKQLPLRAGGPSSSLLRAFAQQGAAAAFTDEGRALGLDAAWPAARTELLAGALEAQRCAALPVEVRASLLTMDRARSALLARNVLALVDAGPTPRVIVLTDERHGRPEIGAPRALQELARRAGRPITQYSVGFQELDAERTQIEEYDTQVAQYDATWLTPPLDAPRGRCP